MPALTGNQVWPESKPLGRTNAAGNDFDDPQGHRRGRESTSSRFAKHQRANSFER